MPEVTTRPRLFPRGSAVLTYWLTHAEGMTVEPLGAVVERVLLPAPFEPPEALVVRLRSSRRERTIPATAIAAVDPNEGQLILDRPPRNARARSTVRHLAAGVEWFAPRFAAAVLDGAILLVRAVGLLAFVLAEGTRRVLESAWRRAHELREAKREVERLPSVQARIEQRLVPRREVFFEHVVGSAEALRDVLAGELEVDASRPHADLPARSEEAL